uniref:Uncharacterized protein n=1 Tax=Tanacetum cinerariifolium TaxID=118510 RepID=A0A699IEB2_TANCI|nr:hypothetical protein [Tanacetum cinerariifolium]
MELSTMESSDEKTKKLLGPDEKEKGVLPLIKDDVLLGHQYGIITDLESLEGLRVPLVLEDKHILNEGSNVMTRE